MGHSGLPQNKTEFGSGFSCQALAQNGDWAFPVATGLLCLLMFYSLISMYISDPGILHGGSVEQDLEAPYMAQVNNKSFPMPWCTKCNLHHLPRNFHCESCKICVEEFDHHCRWINNCVGHRNIRLYLLLLLSLCLYLGAMLASCVVFLVHRRHIPFMDRAMTIIVAVSATGLLLPLILQLLIKARAVSTARRPYETQRDNPFDQGCVTNCYIQMCMPLGPKYVSDVVSLQIELGTEWESTEVYSPAQHPTDFPGPRSPTQVPPRSGQSAPLQEISTKSVTDPISAPVGDSNVNNGAQSSNKEDKFDR
ncbi:palmitoyltransferase ZDHHC19-like [Marmota marmota marmota]|uniref:palmitoyltransferase ZDHHC19-like n=1 Tax=Marmota marmota marmota TaxID=9994 RepID=UPI0007628BBA|nr:palmitoyltransferase ZDHHC19-like [Marmota marmota marmota]